MKLRRTNILFYLSLQVPECYAFLYKKRKAVHARCISQTSGILAPHMGDGKTSLVRSYEYGSTIIFGVYVRTNSIVIPPLPLEEQVSETHIDSV